MNNKPDSLISLTGDGQEIFVRVSQISTLHSRTIDINPSSSFVYRHIYLKNGSSFLIDAASYDKAKIELEEYLTPYRRQCRGAK